MDRKSHWETTYQTKTPTGVSWYQQKPSKSLEMIHASGAGPEARILDAGGGASTLADHLLKEGFRQITVLDISGKALAAAKARIGPPAAAVTWMEGDITCASLADNSIDVWHDRAVFHFLTESSDRQNYKTTLRAALKPGGYVVMATFALDGPPRCSGLDVVRYSPESLCHELGPEFKLIQTSPETHRTPFSTEQKFVYCLFKNS